MSGWLAWLREACSQQCELVGILWREPRFRTPMLALWFSDLGGSLHGPAVTYYYLQLGATPMQIGLLGFGMRGSSMLLSPLYGRAVDRQGVAMPLLLCVSFCGCGCLLRGAAWAVWPLFAAQVLMGMGGACQWSMVKGYVAPELQEAQRALLVVGLRVQMTLLSLTRLFYPALDSLLRYGAGLEETLPRYRAVIGTCAAFCWAGILILLCGEGGASCSGAEDKAKAVHSCAGSAEPKAEAPVARHSCSSVFGAAAAGLGAATCGQTVCLTLWPIYIAHHFDWEARAYAYLSFAYALFSTAALALYPRAVQSGLDDRRALQVLGGISLFTLLGFISEPDGHAGVPGAALHTLLGVPFLVAVGTLVSGAEAVASLLVPAAEQGWAMGMLNAAGACGALAGSLLGPALWTWSLHLGPGALWLLAGGRAPFFATGCLLSASLVLLRYSSAAAIRPSGKAAGADGGSQTCRSPMHEVVGAPTEAGGVVELVAGETEERELLA